MTEQKAEMQIKDYSGGKSTLCTGCGHDSVTQHIISAYFKSGIHPFTVAKISGIGCSSKTPNYFMSQAHGFNSIHGRMGAVATGAKVANNKLNIIGVSGDGDTASIGLGGFIHLIRRNLPMVYIVENNGVYGLTKGQFSATADYDSQKKSGDHNLFHNIDLCSVAIDAGCEFVARSFSGDGKQLVPLIQAAIAHPGTAVIDVISPCITYANNEGSTKSYDYVKEHKVNLQELGFISEKGAADVNYDEGETIEVPLASGRSFWLKKISILEHDVNDRESAIGILHSAKKQNRILTGLLYYRPQTPTLTETLELPATPLSHLKFKDLIPDSENFNRIMERYK